MVKGFFKTYHREDRGFSWLPRQRHGRVTMADGSDRLGNHLLRC